MVLIVTVVVVMAIVTVVVKVSVVLVSVIVIVVTVIAVIVIVVLLWSEKPAARTQLLRLDAGVVVVVVELQYYRKAPGQQTLHTP